MPSLAEAFLDVHNEWRIVNRVKAYVVIPCVSMHNSWATIDAI